MLDSVQLGTQWEIFAFKLNGVIHPYSVVRNLKSPLGKRVGNDPLEDPWALRTTDRLVTLSYGDYSFPIEQQALQDIVKTCAAKRSLEQSPSYFSISGDAFHTCLNSSQGTFKRTAGFSLAQQSSARVKAYQWNDLLEIIQQRSQKDADVKSLQRQISMISSTQTRPFNPNAPFKNTNRFDALCYSIRLQLPPPIEIYAGERTLNQKNLLIKSMKRDGQEYLKVDEFDPTTYAQTV